MKWGGGGGGRQRGLFFHHKYGTRKRPACHLSVIHPWVEHVCEAASPVTTAGPPASSPRCRDSICFTLRLEEGLGIFIPCREQLNANCKAGGRAFKKKGRETQEGGMAFRIGVKLHSDISFAPSQPTDSLGWDTQIPREEPLELIC